LTEIITTKIDREAILKLLELIIPILNQFWGKTIQIAHGAVSIVSVDEQFNYNPIYASDLITII
jgi:hypothetical protein